VTESLQSRRFLWVESKALELSPQGLDGSIKRLSGDDDVASLQAFRTLFDRELDFLAFFKAAVAVTLDGGEMDENVRTAFTLDKTVTFAAVKPFNRTDDPF
jgi:hypothetical protein